VAYVYVPAASRTVTPNLKGFSGAERRAQNKLPACHNMESTLEIHVDFVRLLGATERLVAAGDPSADGSWEHWQRFCQVWPHLHFAKFLHRAPKQSFDLYVRSRFLRRERAVGVRLGNLSDWAES